MHNLQQLKAGYARLLGTEAATLDSPGFKLVETRIRAEPEWANWIFPIWLFSMGETIICSTLPDYAAHARAAFGALHPGDLLKPETLDKALTVIEDKEWVQCELFYYPDAEPPRLTAPHQVEKIEPGKPGVDWLLWAFDGGAYAIRDGAGQLAAHVGIKNKGLLHEVAVGVEPDHRRKGLGQALVAQAIAAILSKGKVPVYWPDHPSNIASVALARSVGFQKGV